MSVRFSLMALLPMLWSAGALAACLPGTPQCPDLSTIPQIAQQIVGQEKITVAPVTAPPGSDPSSGYTGPTVGMSDVLRRAPTIGYHWAIE